MRSLKNNLQPTISLGELLREAEDDPLFYFENYPVQEIRDKCLQLMAERAYPVSSEKEAERAEEQILFFLKGKGDHVPTARKLFAWYIAGTERAEGNAEPLTVRAIEFAIGLYFAHDHSWFESNVSKEVAKRLKRGDAKSIYPQIPNIRKYLFDLVTSHFPTGIVRRIRFKDTSWGIDPRNYSEETWYDVERALGVINHVEDFGFIGILEEALLLYEDGLVFPWKSDAYHVKDFMKDMHMRIISGAIDHLTKCLQEHLRKMKKEALEALIFREYTL